MTRTGAERYLAGRRADPAYDAAYVEARAQDAVDECEAMLATAEADTGMSRDLFWTDIVRDVEAGLRDPQVRREFCRRYGLDPIR